METQLGEVEQEVKKLYLTRGQDFQQVIKPVPGKTFPAGTSAKIVFYKNPTSGVPIATWDAVVTNSEARWRQESEVADMIADRTAYFLYFSFPDSPRTDNCRFYGLVQRKQPR